MTAYTSYDSQVLVRANMRYPTSFIPLSRCQLNYMDTVLNDGMEEEKWLRIRSYFCGLFSSSPPNWRAFREFIAASGNFFYHYLLHCLQIDYPEEYNVTDHVGTVYRHVWLCLEDGRYFVLSKGVLWKKCKTECRLIGQCYQPSFDFPDDGFHPQVILGVESRSPCQLSTYQNKKPMDLITRRVANIPYVVKTFPNLGRVMQLGWKVEEAGIQLYIYYIEDHDRWIYSRLERVEDAINEHAYTFVLD